jgi:hypothetical protein
MSGRDFLEPKVEATPQSALLPRIDGIRVGELVGIADNCTRPLVVYPGQPGTAAIPARSIPDLRGEHIGRQVVLMFDNADPASPIIMGCLQAASAWQLDDKPAQVEVDTDGERLVVSAKDEIVLRCGAASITLTKAGKVLIRGTYVLSRSSGVNRVKGGSVQLN